MSAVSVDELDPATIRGLVARAGDPQRERWLQQVRRTGACRHPVRLRGVVLHGDEPVYSTASEPDGFGSGRDQLLLQSPAIACRRGSTTVSARA